MRTIVFAVSLLAGTQLFGQVSLLDPSFKIAPGADKAVNTLLIQADQRILVGGEFTTIAGQSNAYLARLNGNGSVDRAFNPAGATDARIYCLLQQPDRKVLVGGAFSLTRLLPQNQGNAIRTYVIRDISVPDSSGIAAAATFPPGGTNVLEWSENLKDSQVLEKSSSPYIFRVWSATEQPQAFFRARQER